MDFCKMEIIGQRRVGLDCWKISKKPGAPGVQKAAGLMARAMGAYAFVMEATAARLAASFPMATLRATRSVAADSDH